MPDNSGDTNTLEGIVPGFKDLPVEERMLIDAYRDKPEMMQVYQATKLMQLHGKFEKQKQTCGDRICSLEDSRKKAKWVGGTLLLIFTAVKGFILTKIFGVFG